MQLVHQFEVDAPLERTWAFLQDVPAVAECMPGFERIEMTEPNTYTGAVRLKVGPLGFRLTGNLVRQTIDMAEHAATLGVTAEDRTLASAVSATLRLALTTSEGGQTRVTLHTDANVLGKLGQFGQGAIKLAADSVMKQFASRVRERLARPETIAATESGGSETYGSH
jgi:carbon monoxide dehydrogenase subunit G